MRNTHGALLGMAGILLGLAPGIHADSLQLKTGNFVQGKYLGGTERAVQFEVNGKVQMYDINQILSISFAAASADGGMPSNSAEAKPSSQPELHSVAKKSSELSDTAWGHAKTNPAEVRVQQITWQNTWQVTREEERRSSEINGPAQSLAFGSDCAVTPANPHAKRRISPEGMRVARTPQRIDVLPD